MPERRQSNLDIINILTGSGQRGMAPILGIGYHGVSSTSYLTNLLIINELCYLKKFL